MLVKPLIHFHTKYYLINYIDMVYGAMHTVGLLVIFLNDISMLSTIILLLTLS